jgi:hypothetical protein
MPFQELNSRAARFPQPIKWVNINASSLWVQANAHPTRIVLSIPAQKKPVSFDRKQALFAKPKKDFRIRSDHGEA